MARNVLLQPGRLIRRRYFFPHRMLILVLAMVPAMLACRAGAAIVLHTVASGLVSPLYVTAAGDGSGRLFIVEQAGRIRILAAGSVAAAPFLDIRNQVRSGGELGLLGLAFHPGFRNNGRFFVNYTRNGFAGLETVVSKFSVSGANPNLAVRESEKILLTFAQPFTNHNGGMLAFGPDGFLYIGTGDGGSGGDPQGNGQNLNTLLGKILRIDVDSGTPYGIPADNPFVGTPGRDEIFAYGLRNPWRFSFDRQTGRLFAGDVGQNRYEEIDIIVRGGNYGWNVMEGGHCFSPQTNCNTAGLILPIQEYGRALGNSVTGGYIYRGTAVPSLVGKYLYADFGTGILWALSELSNGQWRNEELLRTGLNVSSFGEDEAGQLYLVDYGGSVQQIVSDGREPVVNTQGTVNAASFLAGPVAPGELVSIFGAGMGPDQGTEAELDSSGRIRRTLAETQVWFDDLAAPLLFVRADQVNAQIPYSTAGKTGSFLQVQYQDKLSNPVFMNVFPAAPGIFTVEGGKGQGAILNADMSRNSPANPASRGSSVVLYATGEGQTNPPGEDGKLSTFPYPTPLLPVAVMIGGIQAELEFVGSAPGFAGLLQVNARVPQQVFPGSAVSVVIRIDGVSSQSAVTMAVN
ncbi:MAG: PQQ-dependent sugar dehydrogenase [Acidobacteria bacterium]|nr:PQQ-dependent sugar dehydrogenase [Acidobacteriota bacterium]